MTREFLSVAEKAVGIGAPAESWTRLLLTANEFRVRNNAARLKSLIYFLSGIGVLSHHEWHMGRANFLELWWFSGALLVLVDAFL